LPPPVIPPHPTAAPHPGPVQGKEFWLIGLLVLLAVGLRLTFFSGLFGHDDWVYLFYIRSHLNGDNTELLQSLWGLRFPIWVPVALAFKSFGVSYWAAFLPGFLCGLAAIPMVYLGLRFLRFGMGIATLGAVFLILNPIDFLVSTTFRGDIEMSFYGGAILLSLLFLRRAEGRKRLYWGLATGVIWALSALTKEWGYVFAWGIFVVAMVDLISERRLPWEYAAVAVGFSLMVFLDAALLRFLTGDWLARVHTSLSWYQNAGVRGEYLYDGSTHYRYLSDLFLGLHTELTAPGQASHYAPHVWFGQPINQPLLVNHYPYLGPYMWLLVIALPITLFARGPARPAACFVVGILLWVEFGSMSWKTYLPFHKEPRYFTIISVPAALVMAAAAAHVFRAGVPRLYKIVTAGFIAGIAITVLHVNYTNHQAYVHGRDFMPQLISWLDKNPRARLWTRASIQNEIDLRTGYRFADPPHNHVGQPGFGAVMDAALGEKRQVGDFVLIQPDWPDPASQFPAAGSQRLRLVGFVSGRYSSGMIYQLIPPEKAADESTFLSDEKPAFEDFSFSSARWDASFDTSPIVINGVRYRRGIGVHSRSEIVFPVRAQRPVFTAKIGLEDSATGTQGSVVFSVYGDKTLLYQSPVMRSKSPTLELDIDLGEARDIRLVVDDAGDGNSVDHAAWAEPKMSPRKTK
jgi:4-amino-4-deoxy-L-arabinose transferase-like glycosyltransferase